MRDLERERNREAGNLGENSFLNANDQYPVSIYGKDFNNNGTTWQCIPSKFIVFCFNN